MRLSRKFAVSFIIVLSILPVLCFAQFSRQVPSQQYGTTRFSSRSSAYKVVQLTEPNTTGEISLEKALAERRSVRNFSQKELTYQQIGQLAWAGQGITDNSRRFRTAPSAGAIYPITLYFATSEGVFTYNAEEHTLQQIIQGDITNQLTLAAFGQNAVGNAPCKIIIAGSARKLAAKYQTNARKYLLLEAGHVAQNTLLQAVALDLAAVPIGSFNLETARQLCKMPRNMEPIYIIPVGHLAEKKTPRKRKPEGKSQKKDPSDLKNAVLIIPGRNFDEMQLLETQKSIADSGVNTMIASSKTGVVAGMRGRRTRSDMLINKINVDDFEAFIFIGGSGASEFLYNPAIEKIITEADEKNKIIAAIAPTTLLLAKAGILNGVSIAALPSQRQFFETAGANLSPNPIEKDGNIITATGSQNAAYFGKTIANAVIPFSGKQNSQVEYRRQQGYQQNPPYHQFFNQQKQQ